MSAPIPARPVPRRISGPLPWLRRNLFSSVANALASLALLAVLGWLAAAGWRWGVQQAVFVADADLCQAARGIGACWGVIQEKARFILLGRYPQSDSWRPVLATFALLTYRRAKELMRERLATALSESRCLVIAVAGHAVLLDQVPMEGRF